MPRAFAGDITLEYEVAGEGEPVIFIHGAFIADAFLPVAGEAALANGYQRILYHRRGYRGSGWTPGPIPIERQAADCRAVLEHLGVSRAHVVGHSFGGAIALQLALDAPELVRSLAVLEPALMLGESGPSYRESLLRGRQRCREEGPEMIVHEQLRARCPGYRELFDLMLPDALSEAIDDAGSAFELDVGFTDWKFGEEEARRIMQPTLVVLGRDSEALWSRFGEGHRALLEWLAHPEEAVIPRTTHFMHVESPRAVAKELVAFFERHPLPRPKDDVETAIAEVAAHPT